MVEGFLLSSSTNSGVEYAVFVFAKAPGQADVKTRLSDVLDQSQRQELQADLMSRTLTTAISTGHEVQLWTTDMADAKVKGLVANQSVLLAAQQGADLGNRMMNAIKQGLRSYKGIILIHSDYSRLISPPYLP